MCCTLLVQAITLKWKSGGLIALVAAEGTNIPIEFLDGSRSIVKVFPRTTASGITAALQHQVCVGALSRRRYRALH